MSATPTALCRLDELDDPGARGFVIERDGARQALLVVRRAGEVFGYVNDCPHIHVPLDWVEGQFLDFTRSHILCANHGARFDIASGVCVVGPCAGKSLTAVPVRVSEGWVYALQ